jgi:hypothetical protein
LILQAERVVSFGNYAEMFEMGVVREVALGWDFGVVNGETKE